MQRTSPEFVTFHNDKDQHQYFNEKMEQYISCTTVLGNYKEPFDQEYWSLYKAIEEVVDAGEHTFADYKRFCGGYKHVVSTWIGNKFKEEEIHKVQDRIKADWGEIANRACVEGTAEHDARERTILQYKKMRGMTTGAELTVIQDTQSKENTIMNFRAGNKIFTEALVWNDQYKVAGQVDYIEQEGIYLDIKDYKTNKDKMKKGVLVPGIKMSSYQDQRMLHPLTEVLDCNWFHYMLQMSLYGWMAEQEGYKVRSLELIWIKEGEPDRIMPTTYRPDLIEIMLGHYAKTKRYIK
jgi:hypothetical protein